MRLLAFEDATEARELCEHHGLTVTSDGLLDMGRTGFVDPETAFPPHRAARLIHSKQTTSLGEVCGLFIIIINAIIIVIIQKCFLLPYGIQYLLVFGYFLQHILISDFILHHNRFILSLYPQTIVLFIIYYLFTYYLSIIYLFIIHLSYLFIYYLSDEPGELSQWLVSWWQHHKHCPMYYYYLYIVWFTVFSSCCMWSSVEGVWDVVESYRRGRRLLLWGFFPSVLSFPSPSPNPARGLGEHCELPQRGLGQSPSHRHILGIFWGQGMYLVAMFLFL